MRSRVTLAVAAVILVGAVVGFATVESRQSPDNHQRPLQSSSITVSSPSSAAAGEGAPSSPVPTSSTQPINQRSDNGCIPTKSGTMVVKGTLQGFYPSAINVTVGQTVTFTMGPMVFSCAFDQVGNFTYHCADHPFMTVAVTVRE